jgi:type III restriction enzyme
MPQERQLDIPIQPVNKPILCSPYEEPREHWQYKINTDEAFRVSTRRPGAYWFKSRRTGMAQKEFGFITEEESEPLPLVNALRSDVRRWRDGGYANATRVTKQLLRHWWSKDRARRLFFCQLEAVEKIIYLNEVLASGKKPHWKSALSVQDFQALRQGKRPTD